MGLFKVTLLRSQNAKKIQGRFGFKPETSQFIFYLSAAATAARNVAERECVTSRPTLVNVNEENKLEV